MTKKTKTYSHHFKFDVGKYSKWRSGTRSLFQLLQGDFDPNSSKDYFVFFQLVYSRKGYLLNEKSEFSKYASSKLYKCLSLAHIVVCVAVVAERQVVLSSTTQSQRIQ